MEMPPIGKGGSDIIWALPFFGLVVFALAAWSSPCVGWPLNESLNRTLGLSRPYSEFSQRIDGLFHRQPDDVCE